MNKLACGCIRGQWLCLEAERLWAEVNRAYRQSKGQHFSEETWEDYQRALREYNAHFQKS